MKQIKRKGCRDVFNAFMVEGATFEGKYDFPVSSTIKEEIPTKLIAYDLTKSSTDYDSYVHFYIDDYKFDGKRGIWTYPEKTLERLKKFKGVITPDFSTNIDFPVSLKIYNTYRMRAYGYYLSNNGVNVINNVRWSDPSSYDYCFAGIPKHSIVSIGTIGCLKDSSNWEYFQKGLDEMIRRIEPKIILVYGTMPDKFFKKYIDDGIIFIRYKSQTEIAFEERSN